MSIKKKDWATAVTELEGTVLGIIGLQGRCTPYAIRRVFQESPSTYWSGSAGAIYPLVLRLQRRGFLRGQRQFGDARGGRLYHLTPVGERALQAWLGPPCAPITISVPPDPLRTRVGFLCLLDAKKRRAFLDDAASQMRTHLKTVRDYSERQRAAGDQMEYFASLGSARMLKARLEWLQEVMAAVCS